VTGPPRRICSWNSGTTEPEEASTLPNRTMQKRVVPGTLLQRLQHQLREALGRPHDIGGFTALSVEMSTKVSTLVSSAASAAYQVLITLL
jgi:hypothetical protein